MNQFFSTRDGTLLHLTLSEVDKTSGWVLLLHGIGDHSGRYDHVAGRLNANGLSVLRFDLRGHGRSGGKVAYVRRFQDYVSDFGEVVERMRGFIHELPLFVVAHSMGALIAATWILDHPDVFKGAVFSSGLFKVNEDISPFLQKISGVVSFLMPTMKTVTLDYSKLSRDPSVLEDAAQDPLHYKGGIRARTGHELMRATRAIGPRLGEWRLPVFLLHGEADELTRPEASRKFYGQAVSTDKQLRIYEGAYHELMHEINREEVLHDIVGWLKERE